MCPGHSELQSKWEHMNKSHWRLRSTQQSLSRTGFSNSNWRYTKHYRMCMEGKLTQKHHRQRCFLAQTFKMLFLSARRTWRLQGISSLERCATAVQTNGAQGTEPQGLWRQWAQANSALGKWPCAPFLLPSYSAKWQGLPHFRAWHFKWSRNTSSKTTPFSRLC